MTRRPTAAELLEGPRGRRLCLQVAGVLDPTVADAGFMIAHERTTSEEVVRRVRALDLSPVAAQEDPLAFLWQVADSVVFAYYWQEPDETDALLAADAALRDALLPVAEALLAAPATAWWSSPIALDEQHDLAWTTEHERGLTPITGAGRRLAAWRPDPRPGSAWWSGPVEARPVRTTRAVSGLVATELMWAEECGGDFQAAVVRPLLPTRAPRVYEMDGPDAWTALVERFPCDVTASRAPQWADVSGRACSWWVPDWSAVAAEYDAVHVTVTGYLTTATRALDVTAPGGPDRPAATLLGDWNPDETFWLTDVLEALGDPEPWVEPDDRPHPETLGPAHGWRPASSLP